MSYFSMESDKVSVLIAMDLFQDIFSMAVCHGYMNTEDIEKSIGKLLSKDNVICSRPNTIFTTFLRRMHIKQSEKTLNNTKIAIKYIHDYMTWMSRFKGVATKYLNNYLSLYKFLHRINYEETLPGVKSIIAAIGAVNIKNTYMSVKNSNLYVSS